MQPRAIPGDQQGVSDELHPLVIPKFDGRYKFLSNDYLCPIIMDGQEYPCAMTAYLAKKGVAPTDSEAFVSLTAKADSMYGVLELKFSQSPSLRTWLLETDNAILVNSNDYHDNYWGACVCKNCLSKPGQNVLGELLMHLRRKLRHVADAHCP